MEWINVKDRLPDEGQEVIVFRSEDYIDKIRIARFRRGGFSCLCEPTHWMPLPDQPLTKD